MKLIKYIVIFLIVNFGALAIGSWLMDSGPQTEWYLNLNKAPWTPPGWVFGAAWSFIMVCFSFYMAYLYQIKQNQNILTLFALQFFFNVIWNYAFFNKHFIELGLMIIGILTLIVGLFTVKYKQDMKAKTFLILPYFIWLCLATSLNAYIVFYN